jgi:FkbM family methyltransferase
MNWNILFNYIRPQYIIDIGAHIGNFTQSLMYYYPGCQCHMIEANPYCDPHLSKLNVPYTITTLSSTEKDGILYLEKINNIGTGVSLYKENTQYYQDGKYDALEVKTSTLDNLNIFSEKNIDLIKIDTQGSELDILEGGVQTISRTQYLLLEVSLLNYNEESPLIDVVVNRLRDYKFKVEDILDYNYITDKQIFQLDILFKNLNN